MRRCEMAVGLVGVAIWFVAYALVSLVIFLTFAVPLGLLFVLDALVGERASTVTATPPAPPRQPITARASGRLAA